MGGRPVTESNGRIPADEFLVFYFLNRDQVRCDSKGNFLTGQNEAGVLFHSLEEAKTFARAQADLSPRIGAGVYTSSWQIVAEFGSDEYVKQQARANSPARLLLIASALLICGSALIWLEIHSGWSAIVGFLIGSRLLLSGILKLGTGLYRLKGKSR